MEKLNKFLKQIKKSRQEIKYNRKNFWRKNKVNFMNNLKTLVTHFPTPNGWRVNIAASYFLLDKEEISMPYDDDVWSFVDIVGATEKQGKDIVVFFNRTDLEFLSSPALSPLIIHEMKHVEQAARDPEKYIKTGVDDELNKVFEIEAEAEVKNYSDEFRKQNVLEKVMYAYDKKGWKGAKKMVNYLHVLAKDAFGGGYNQDMQDTEYNIFLRAEEEKDIDLFIDYFIETFVEPPKEIIREETKSKEEVK